MLLFVMFLGLHLASLLAAVDWLESDYATGLRPIYWKCYIGLFVSTLLFDGLLAIGCL